MYSSLPLPSPTAAGPPARKERQEGREGGSVGRSLAMLSDARAAAGTEGPGSGAGAGWCWQGAAMVTCRRDAEPRVLPALGLVRRQGDNGAGEAKLPPQAVLLCCSVPSVSCQEPAGLRPPAALTAGLGLLPLQAVRCGVGTALGEPHEEKAASLGGC